MLIPSIDLMGGRIVQLERGERLRWATDDPEPWIERLGRFPLVQVIDLDAARGAGENTRFVERLCRRLPCQVGGGIRSVEAARARLDGGARRVILGSALFDRSGVRAAAAEAFAAALGPAPIVAAIDSLGGRVVVDGWRTALDLGAADAARALEPHVGRFLYTHVETEGLLQGFNRAVLEPLRRATVRPVIAAGGIRDMDEVRALDALGIDAVVGMAIYTARIPLAP